MHVAFRTAGVTEVYASVKVDCEARVTVLPSKVQLSKRALRLDLVSMSGIRQAKSLQLVYIERLWVYRMENSFSIRFPVHERSPHRFDA